MSNRATIASFGRRAAATHPRMLGADPPADTGPACGFGDFLGDAPLDTTTNKPSTIGNGVREGLKFVGILSAGALLGAVISPQKRARNAAIGGGVGALAGAGVVLYQYGGWKDDGGKTHQKGACTGTPQPSQAASLPPKKSAPPKANPPAQAPPQQGGGGFVLPTTFIPTPSAPPKSHINPALLAFSLPPPPPPPPQAGAPCVRPDGSIGQYDNNLFCDLAVPVPA